MDTREKESRIRECLLGFREKLNVQVEAMIVHLREIMSFDKVADIIAPELTHALTDDEVEALSLPMKLETDKAARLRKLVADKMKEYAEKSLAK